MIYKQQLIVTIYLRTRFFIPFAPSELENSFFSIKFCFNFHKAPDKYDLQCYAKYYFKCI